MPYYGEWASDTLSGVEWEQVNTLDKRDNSMLLSPTISMMSVIVAIAAAVVAFLFMLPAQHPYHGVSSVDDACSVPSKYEGGVMDLEMYQGDLFMEADNDNEPLFNLRRSDTDFKIRVACQVHEAAPSVPLFENLGLGGEQRTADFVSIVDTGSKNNILPAHVYEQWKALGVEMTHDENQHAVAICDASGNQMPYVTKPVNVTMRMGATWSFTVKFLVIQRVSSVILGLDFLKEHYMDIKWTHYENGVRVRSSHPYLMINEAIKIPTLSPNDYDLIGSPFIEGELEPSVTEVNFAVAEEHLSVLSVNLKNQDEFSPLSIEERVVQVKNGVVTVPVYNAAGHAIEYSPDSLQIEYEILKDAAISTSAVTYETNAFGIPISKQEDPIGGKNKPLGHYLQNQRNESGRSENAEKFQSLLLTGEKNLNLPDPPFRDEPSNDPLGSANEDDILPKGFDKDTVLEDWKTTFRRTATAFPPELKEKFIQELTARCSKVFATHAMDAGHLDPNIMVIEDLHLKDDQPVRSSAIKLDYIRRQQIQEMLDQLEKYGIIRKSASQHYSPVFVVAKGNGALRLVTSYCKLNSKMKSQFYQVPDTKHVLKSIAQANGGRIKYMTQIDLSNAYSSIELRGEAQQQMGLISMDHTYIALRLMFGSQIAPAKFNEALKRVLDRLNQDPNNPWCFSFFDDITVVTGDDKEEHMEKVVRVLEVLGQAGFKVQMEKCAFFQEEIEVLGMKINRQGVSPLNKHVAAVHKLKPPTSVHEVMKIQGLLCWHSHLIPNFSHHMAPISKLTRKDQPFIWGREQQEALEFFQRTITDQVLTYFPDYSSEVYLCTDASELAVGAVAYQIKSYKNDSKELVENILMKDLEEVTRDQPLLPQPGKRTPKPFTLLTGDEKKLAMTFTESTDGNATLEPNEEMSKLIHVCQPIAYFSKTLNTTQMNYDAVEREALGLVLAVEQLQDLLLGFKERYLITDSQPLLYIMRKVVSDDSKMGRWLLKLKQVPMDMTVVHCKGELNIIADLMSRCMFMGMMPKTVDPSVPPKLSKKYPVIIKSPFQPGQVITFDDVKRVITKNPGIVYNLNPKKENSTSTVEVETLGYIGSSVASILHSELHPENIIKHQGKDELCSARLARLRNGIRMEGFHEHQGILHRKKFSGQSPHERGRICIPDSLLPSLIAYYHVANHCGAEALYRMLRVDYYCYKLFQKVTAFCQSCYLCMICKAHQTKQPFAEKPYAPISKMSTWSIDIVSGFPPARGGYRHILTCTESYSHFIVAFKLRTGEADEIAVKIRDLFTIFPIPSTIISDNGANLLRSRSLRSLCLYFGVNIHCTSPYSSQSNALVERSHRKIRDLLSVVTEATETKWNEVLPQVVVALNGKPVQSVEYMTPTFIVFGCHGQPMLAFRQNEEHYSGYGEVAEDWKRLQARTDRAINKYLRERNRQNQLAGVKTPRTVYEKGSFVFLKNVVQTAYSKINPKYYRVPLMVIADIGQVVVLKDYQQRIRKTHKDLVFKCKPLEKNMYDSLPHEFKMRVMIGFTEEDLKQYFVDAKKVPHIFFKNTDPIPKPYAFEDLYSTQLTQEELEALAEAKKREEEEKQQVDERTTFQQAVDQGTMSLDNFIRHIREGNDLDDDEEEMDTPIFEPVMSEAPTSEGNEDETEEADLPDHVIVNVDGHIESENIVGNTALRSLIRNRRKRAKSRKHRVHFRPKEVIKESQQIADLFGTSTPQNLASLSDPNVGRNPDLSDREFFIDPELKKDPTVPKFAWPFNEPRRRTRRVRFTLPE